MTRSKWKIPVINNTLIKRISLNIKKPTEKIIKIYSKNSIIIPQFIGLTLEVYNGKEFISLLIKEQMISHKLGEFIFTRKKHIYKKKSKTKK